MVFIIIWSAEKEWMDSTCNQFMATQQSSEEKGISASNHRWNLPRHLRIHFCISHWFEHGIPLNPNHQRNAENPPNCHNAWFLWIMMHTPNGNQTGNWQLPIKNGWCIPTNDGANKPHPYIEDFFHAKETDLNGRLIIWDEILKWSKEAGMQVNMEKRVSAAPRKLNSLYSVSSRQVSSQSENESKPSWKLYGLTTWRRYEISLVPSTLSKITSPTMQKSWTQSYSYQEGSAIYQGKEQQQAFDKTKAAMANATLCTYPNPSKCFIIFPKALYTLSNAGARN